MSGPYVEGGLPATRRGADIPDWVVLGAHQHDGKVAVYASKDLTDAELRYDIDYDDDPYEFAYIRHRCVRRGIYHVTVGMRTFTVVVADTYEQALRTLFETWSPEPDPAERLALGGAS